MTWKAVIPASFFTKPSLKLTEYVRTRRLDILPPGEQVTVPDPSSVVEGGEEDPKSLSPDPQEG